MRKERGLKLAALSQAVPISTVNAIERGHIIPSLRVVDALTTELELPVGAFDLPFLASSRDGVDRTTVLARLVARGVSPLAIQRSLRQAARASTLSTREQAHAWYVLAEVLYRRGHYQRAAVILRYIADHLPHGPLLRGKIGSLWGKSCLARSHPDEALQPLLQAVAIRRDRRAWESAMCNLGLAWWMVGQHVQAEQQWQRVVDQVSSPELRAHAYFGLGNAALRRRENHPAVRWYRQALALYPETSWSNRLKALNNILVCGIRLRDWPDVAAVVAEGDTLVNQCDPVARGEWLATCAEAAWAQSRSNEARHLASEAQALLGSAPCLSWFSVRLLQIKMDAYDHATRTAVMTEMDDHLGQVSDPQLRAALHVALVQMDLAAGRYVALALRLRATAGVLPPIGSDSDT